MYLRSVYMIEIHDTFVMSSNPYLLLMLFSTKPLEIVTFVLKTFQVLYFSNKIRTDAKIPSDAISTNGNVVFLYFEINIVIFMLKICQNLTKNYQ